MKRSGSLYFSHIFQRGSEKAAIFSVLVSSPSRSILEPYPLYPVLFGNISRLGQTKRRASVSYPTRGRLSYLLLKKSEVTWFPKVKVSLLIQPFRLTLVFLAFLGERLFCWHYFLTFPLQGRQIKCATWESKIAMIFHKQKKTTKKMKIILKGRKNSRWITLYFLFHHFPKRRCHLIFEVTNSTELFPSDVGLDSRKLSSRKAPPSIHQ